MQFLQPSSLSNFKRKARDLKKSLGCSTSEAYALIAKKNGFNSWKELLSTINLESENQNKISQGFYKDPSHYHQMSFLALEIAKKNHPDIHTLESLPFSERVKISSEANAKFSADLGYSNFNEYLKDYFISSESYTFPQKIGSICRSLEIDPLSLKNTIHILIADENAEAMQEIKNFDSVFEPFGIVRDHDFASKIQAYDSYFNDELCEYFYRILPVDTNIHSNVYDFIHTLTSHIGEKLEVYDDIDATCVWINGVLDPVFFKEIKHMCKIDKIIPPKELLPEEIWRGVY